MRSISLLSAALALLVAAAAGCTSIGPQPTPVAPTKTPKPTFTPTPDWTPTPVVFATVAPVAAAPTAEAAAPAQPDATTEPAAAEQPTAEPPTATPNTVTRLTANQTVNVRRGPGTNYPVIGRLTAGQAFAVTGKNPRGDWYQFDFDGQPAWVIANLVSVSGDPAAVQVAENIPAAPTPRPTARPVARPQPTAPPAQPQPTAVPARQYEFNIAKLQRCDPNAGVTYVNGTVYKNGTPINGKTVAFSYAPDGPVVASIQAGPHTGYPGWSTGFYSHILGASGPRAGDWYFWIVESGQRISEIAHIHTDGEAGDGKCQQGIIDFDSR
jgi:uncharacterized protein YraI